MNKPDFDFDLAYGEAGERTVLWDLEALNTPGSYEVKRKRIRDDKFFIEGWQHPHSLVCETGATCKIEHHWLPSGINTTTASHVAYLVADTGIWVHFPTATLRAALTTDLRKSVAGGRNGDNPTRGTLANLNRILLQS